MVLTSGQKRPQYKTFASASPLQALAKLTALNALNISFNPLQTFPKVIADLTSLLELNLDFTSECLLDLHVKLMLHNY